MTARNILMAASGASTDANYIEDVFSTWLYTGTGATQSINNGMDLTKPGYLIWAKSRSATGDHRLQWAANNFLNNTGLSTNLTSAAGLATNIIQLKSNGYDLGGTTPMNTSGTTYASWTFRKQPKFFDIVTYTGDGTNSRSITHALGSAPGCIMVKRTDSTGDWLVYHRSLTLVSVLNSDFAAGLLYPPGNFGNGTTMVTPTSSVFTVAGSSINASGATYVAYLFAHDAGGFGLTGTDNVISCGSYTGNGSNTGPIINLGYEPQWVMIKNTNGAGGWNIVDVMRGMPTATNTSQYLRANATDAEATSYYAYTNATGFQIGLNNSEVNTSGSTYIYIAIRRGPMKVPTTGTSVFAPIYVASSTTGAARTSGFPSDLVLGGRTNSSDSVNNWYFIDRLRGMLAQTDDANGAVVQKKLISSSTAAETTSQSPSNYPILYSFGNTDAKQGLGENFIGNGGNLIYYFFRRAPGFFDQVCYTGTGSVRTVNHNLTVAPELMIIKQRNAAQSWAVYAAPLGATKFGYLNFADVFFTGSTMFNNTDPTSSVFTLGSNGSVNTSTQTYVAYLFASCPGVSKVGSYTGNGSSQTINCSFTAGARFVMVKRTDFSGATSDWYVWDTARGIVTASDPRLSLNTTAAEVTTDDSVDPASSGFIVNQLSATNINVNAASYIFLAIA